MTWPAAHSGAFSAIFAVVAASVSCSAPPKTEAPRAALAVSIVDRVRPTSDVDEVVGRSLKEGHREGAAMAVVKNGAVVWKRGYGLANVARHEAVDTETVFLVASLSKVVLAIAVMQVADETSQRRGVNISALLDEDVNDLIAARPADGLAVRHPAYPKVPITLRMLLTHTSSIHNRYALAPHHVQANPLRPAPPTAAENDRELRRVHAEYLRPGGKYFHVDNFLPERPGTKAEYSSVASAIAAHFVSAQSGVPFDTYCKEHIFLPLGMTRTAWHVADLGAWPALAMPYKWANEKSVMITPPVWENTFYPAASLRSTISDMARFLVPLTGTGEPLLSRRAMRELVHVQVPYVDATRAILVGWEQRAGLSGVGHSGANEGFRSDLFFTPRESVKGPDAYGVVVLTNGDDESHGAFEPKLGAEILRRALRAELD